MTNTLSPRERQVLAELAKGEGGKIVAHRLGITMNTLKTVRHDAAIKLHAHSLIECFVKLGWLVVPPLRLDEKLHTEGCRAFEYLGSGHERCQCPCHDGGG